MPSLSSLILFSEYYVMKRWLYFFFSNTTKMIKARRMRWVDHLTSTGGLANA
jgi:hypothetical protein